MFKKLFGESKGGPSAPSGSGGKPTAANQTINAIQNLSEREEQLEKRKSLLEKRVNEELEKAKEFTRQKKKSQALLALKKKKMYEQQLEQLDTLILRVNEQKMMLENQRTTADVVSSMHQAATASKNTMKEMKIENVDQIMDEIQEQNDQMRMISEAISQPTGLAAELDEDELLGELEDLEAEELDKQLLKPAPVPTTAAPAAEPAAKLPSVPQKAAAAKTPEELELEQLQAELAM